MSSPVELEDIWEGDGDDAGPEGYVRGPSVPLDRTEEGLRAQDIILKRLSTTHPPPPAARVSSTSGGGSSNGYQHQQGPRISAGAGSAPLAKRISGRTSSSGGDGKKPFEAREGAAAQRFAAQRTRFVLTLKTSFGNLAEGRHSGRW